MDNIEIEEMFQALGPVTIKRMFGGKGVYHMGRIVAVEVNSEMLLKADEISGPGRQTLGLRGQKGQGRQHALLVDPRRCFRRSGYHGTLGKIGL
jgi:DNA transformation protein